MPFGPEISWPYGFRQLDSQSRDAFESAYGTGSVYQQPAMDDYGYGDPGYSDPTYDGPRAPYPGRAFPAGNPVFPGDAVFPGDNGAPRTPRAFDGPGYRQPDTGVPGYHVPEIREVPENRDSSRPGYADPGHLDQSYPDQSYPDQNYPDPGYFAAPPSRGHDIYPVTGAQEALPDAAPRPSAAAPWAAQDHDGFTATGTSAYPEQWYDNPRLDDRVRDVAPPADLRPADPHPSDPRLEGIRYDELRYDEPSPDGPGFTEALEDDSWLEELRRSAPVYPQNFADGSHPSGPSRRVEPQFPGYGQQAGFPQAPAPERPAGYGPPRGDRGIPGPQNSGPQLNAGWVNRPGGQGGQGTQPGPARPGGQGAQGAGFLGAPTAQVGVLTPPTGSRLDALRESDPLRESQDTTTFTALPGIARPGAAPVRPGHGLDGPAITASWPTQPSVGEADSLVRPGHGLDGPAITGSWPTQPPVSEVDTYEEFWRDDDEEAEYKGLFGDREDPDAARAAAKRRIGRRRGGSNDHRLWLGLGGVVIISAAAITGIIKFEFPSHGGPTHVMSAPAKIGTYTRTADLERQANVAKLREEVITMSSGQASGVVSAVYEQGNSAAGNNEQIIMFIGGHLANAAPATSIASFTQKFPGAQTVSAGSLGGNAACVEDVSAGASMCAWFDNDSFGEIVSPTMDAPALAKAMLTVRPAVETVVKH